MTMITDPQRVLAQTDIDQLTARLAAAERERGEAVEACARVAERERFSNMERFTAHNRACNRIAAAIRELKKEK